MKLAAIAILIFLSVFSQASYALVDPCENDRSKFCGVYGDKDPRRLYCLKSRESQLSSACRGSLKDIKGTDVEFIDDCSEDYHRFCSATRQGKGRILECLRTHSKELDFECRKKVNMMPRH